MTKSASGLKTLEKEEVSQRLVEQPVISQKIESWFVKERDKIGRLVYEQINQFVQNSIIAGLKLSEKRLLSKNTDGIVRVFRRLERLIAQNVKKIRKHISELEQANETDDKLFILKSSSQEIKIVIKEAKLREKIKGLLIEERNRVAHHLHDEVLQNLATISVGLQLCEKLLNKDGARVLRQIGDLKRLAYQTTYEISEFRSKPTFQNIDEKKLVLMLKEYIKTFKNISDTQVNLKVFGITGAFSPLIAENLFQIIKEALVNAVKHAEASEINLELNFQRHQVFATMFDNGKGFNLETKMARANCGHLGLTGMKKRVESLRGTLGIKTMPGWGTKISVSVPTGFL